MDARRFSLAALRLAPVLLVAMLQGLPAASWSAGVQYDYDALDRLKKVTYEDGSTVEYTFDASGNRKTVVTAAGGGGGGSSTDSFTFTGMPWTAMDGAFIEGYYFSVPPGSLNPTDTTSDGMVILGLSRISWDQVTAETYLWVMTGWAEPYESWFQSLSLTGGPSASLDASTAWTMCDSGQCWWAWWEAPDVSFEGTGTLEIVHN